MGESMLSTHAGRSGERLVVGENARVERMAEDGYF
jgi:hypothetical protein